MSMTVGGVNVKVVYMQDVASYKKVLSQLKQLSAVGVGAGASVSKSMTAVSSSMKTMNTHISKSTSLLKTITTTMKSMLGFFVLNKLVQFGNSAIELASDLEEVQNVVDTTFVSMAHEVDAFARSTLESFGLSELATKRYMGTLGAMLKSMGASTEKAYEMSKGLTQLSGDIASFYNLSGDEAFDKIRSGISGETEPLKALGLNLSVANLEAFALSRGITKSFNAMTEMEKATLRYNYLLSITADAQGDFARTGQGWANQTRLLAENFNILKGILGEGFIVALRPLVVLLNTILVKLQAVATVFTNFIKKLTGWKEEAGGSLGSVVDGTSDVEDGFNNIEEAAKKAKKQVASFDDVIMLSSPTVEDTSSIGGNNGFDLDSYNTIDTLNSELDKTISKLEDFLKGVYDFTLDIGFDWKSIKESLSTILKNIWTTIKNVGVYFIDCSIRFLKDNSIGAVITSILRDLADLSTKIQGTMENALKNIVDIFFGVLQIAFDLVSRLLNDIGIYAIIEHIAYVFEALTGVVKSIIDVLSPALNVFYDNGLKPIVEWLGAVFVKVLDWITEELNKWSEWFIENEDLIVGFFEVLGQMLGEIWSVLEPIASVIVDVLLMFFSMLGDVLRVVIEFLLCNKELAMVLGMVATALGVVWAVMNLNPISLVVVAIMGIIGALGYLYKECEVFRNVVNGVWTFIKSLMQVFVDFIYSIFGPSIDFLVDLFSGNFKSIEEVMRAFVSAGIEIFNNIINFLDASVVACFKNAFNTIVEALKLSANSISLMINGLIDNFKSIISFLKDVFTGNFTSAFDKVAESVVRNLQYMLDGITNFVNFAIEQINKLLSKFSSVQIPKWSGINISGDASGSVGGVGVRPRYSHMSAYDVALASGGVVSRPQKALIGEAGAEAVIPLENSAFIDKFADMVSSKLSGATNITIKVDNLYGDEAYLTEFVRKMNRVMKKEGMRIGV